MPVTIDTDELVQTVLNYGYGQRHIIETSVGDLFAVQINNSGVIEVKISEDSGVTWTEDTTFGSLTRPNHLSMCKSELDDIFLCFVHNTNYVVVKKKDHTSGTWSEIYNTQHTVSSPEIQTPMIAYNRVSAKLYLFYGVVNAKVYGKISINYGASWGSAINVSGEGGSGSVWVKLYSVGCGLNGSVYLFLYTQSQNYVRTRIVNSDLASGSDVGNIAPGDTNFFGGQIAVDGANNYWRLFYWKNGTDYHLKVDKNTVSSLDVNYGTTDTLWHGNLAIGIDNKDNVYIFYVKSTDSICYYRKYDAEATTWGDETQLSISTGLRPSCDTIVRSGSTKLKVVYTATE